MRQLAARLIHTGKGIVWCEAIYSVLELTGGFSPA